LGHTAGLVTCHLGRDADIPGVTLRRIPRVPLLKEIEVGPSWYKPFLDLLLLGKAIRLLLRTRYDVIHSHEEAGFFSVPLAYLFRTRHLYDMHSSLPHQLGNFGFGNYRPIVKLFELLENKTIRSCDALITIGSDLEAYARQLHPGVKQVMIENLPTQFSDAGTDEGALDQLRTRLGLQGKLPIVYTGTFERYQGIELLLQSAAIVKQQRPDAVFLMVGGKPHQVEQAKAEAKRLGVDDCVRFLGTVPVEDVGNYVDIAEILVSPRVEGTSVPLKIYSYLASGKPVVATDLLAHTIVLHDDIAVLAAPTKEAFADGILKLANDPALRQRIGANAQEFAKKHYDRSAYLEKLSRIYGVLQAPTQGSQQTPHVANN